MEREDMSAARLCVVQASNRRRHAETGKAPLPKRGSNARPGGMVFGSSSRIHVCIVVVVVGRDGQSEVKLEMVVWRWLDPGQTQSLPLEMASASLRLQTSISRTRRTSPTSIIQHSHRGIALDLRILPNRPNPTEPHRTPAPLMIPRFIPP